MVQPTAIQNVHGADPRNYQLPGRVCLFFRKKNGAVSDWRDLGNIINPGISPNITRLDHFSQRRSERVKDRSLISERQALLNFTIDEINRDNLRLLFQQPGATTPGATIIPLSKIHKNPGSLGVINLGVISLEAIGTEVVRDTLQEDGGTIFVGGGVDYTYNPALGTITIAAAGALMDASEATGTPEIHIFAQKSVDTEKFEIFPGSEVEGEAKFHVISPNGIQYQIEFGNVVVRNNGDFTIGDGTDFQQVPLQLDVLADSNGQLGTMHVVDNSDRL